MKMRDYKVVWPKFEYCRKVVSTVVPHIRPAGTIIICMLSSNACFIKLWIPFCEEKVFNYSELHFSKVTSYKIHNLENTTFLLHTVIRIEGIIRAAGIIRGRALYEEIR